jgi:uncharacterized Zn-binding protein involved in type VI secretion
MPEAARIDDPIAHSSAMLGLLGGVVAGAIIGGMIAAATVATVATGGAALGLIIAGGALGASAVGGILEVVGSMSFMPMWDTGVLANGSGNVFVNDRASIRAHLDYTKDCSGSPPIYWPHHGMKRVAEGSDSVFINDRPASRVGDMLTCSAKIHHGSANVFIGGGTFRTDAIDSEIPIWMNWTLAGLGLAGATVLFGPVVAILGFAGSWGGGELFGWLGGKWFGVGSDGQKLMMLGGSILGGSLAGWGAKGVASSLGEPVPGPVGEFIKGGVPETLKTTVYRVEGDPNTRIIIGENGQVSVQGKQMLFLNFGDKARAESFFNTRVAQGMDGVQMKSFQVPKSFLEELQNSAVPESMAKQFPGRPLLVDPTKAPNQFGLRPEQIDSLQDAIIQGSGKVH